MPTTEASDYSERDATIAINTYTTVLRRPRVPHELFATYWRDVHGPLCSRIPGLGWYVQRHLDRGLRVGRGRRDRVHLRR
jgi:hypothetical protein